MLNIVKNNLFVSIIVLVVVLAGGSYFYFSREDEPSYEFAIAERGDLNQEVNITGKVKPAESVKLAFEKTGRVSRVYVNIGNKVSRGEILVSLDNGELSANLSKAEADLEVEEAKLLELVRGTRPEEIQVQEVKVGNAEVAFNDSKRNMADTIQDAYTKSDDAIRNKVDQFITNPRSSNPAISFSSPDSQLEIQIESRRVTMEAILNSWSASLTGLAPVDGLSLYIATAKTNLGETKSFLNLISSMINILKTNSNLSQATIDGYRSDVATARTNLNTAISNLSLAEEKLGDAESSLKVEQNELALFLAGTTPEALLQQEAKIKSSRANVQNIEAQVSKTILRSPINGVVTQQDAKVGEIVSANAILVAVISEGFSAGGGPASGWEIEANIPEADVAKIKLGNKAEVTLDAYGNDIIFEAEVFKIDPAETVIEGVSTYKTTLQFLNGDGRIRSGMTANIDIMTANLSGVIRIPQRSVFTKDGVKFIRVLKDGNVVEEIMVVTGLRGSDGNIEIKSGLEGGERVITFFEE